MEGGVEGRVRAVYKRDVNGGGRARGSSMLSVSTDIADKLDICAAR